MLAGKSVCMAEYSDRSNIVEGQNLSIHFQFFAHQILSPEDTDRRIRRGEIKGNQPVNIAVFFKSKTDAGSVCPWKGSVTPYCGFFYILKSQPSQSIERVVMNG
jgi:hypothetical protein